MALTNIDGIESMVTDNLTDAIELPQTSNQEVNEEVGSELKEATTSTFEQDDSMDFLMNKIGLAVQRNGGE